MKYEVDNYRSVYLEGTHERFINTHHSAGIVKLATIVGSRKQSDQLPFGEKLVSIFDDLMRPTDEVEVMSVQELADHVGSERERYAAVILRPALNVFIRIGP